MIDERYKYSELTSKIIGCAMEVHRVLGNGFQEVIYQRALEKEFRLQGISFNREFEMPIFYKEEKIGTRRVDFLVEGVVSVELKALINLEDVHLTQAINIFGSLLFGNRHVDKFRSKKFTVQAIDKFKI